MCVDSSSSDSALSSDESSKDNFLLSILALNHNLELIINDGYYLLTVALFGDVFFFADSEGSIFPNVDLRKH